MEEGRSNRGNSTHTITEGLTGDLSPSPKDQLSGCSALLCKGPFLNGLGLSVAVVGDHTELGSSAY